MKRTLSIHAAIIIIMGIVFSQCKNANVDKHEGFPSGKSDNRSKENTDVDNKSSHRSTMIVPARKVISDQMIPDNYKPGDSSVVMQQMTSSKTSVKRSSKNESQNSDKNNTKIKHSN